MLPLTGVSGTIFHNLISLLIKIMTVFHQLLLINDLLSWFSYTISPRDPSDWSIHITPYLIFLTIVNSLQLFHLGETDYNLYVCMTVCTSHFPLYFPCQTLWSNRLYFIYLYNRSHQLLSPLPLLPRLPFFFLVWDSVFSLRFDSHLFTYVWFCLILMSWCLLMMIAAYLRQISIT
jgi:hypothetical protein